MKTILVTGASSGIGRALAVRAARAGYAVYAVGRNLKALAALAGQVTESGGIIATDLTDVSDPANAPGLIGRMMGAFGRVDVLVNNAGAVAVGPIAAQTDEDLRVQFGTHVVGPLALVREALPSLRASRGHVFMLGSGVARVPVGGLGAYPPSKAALRSATAVLRREVAPLEIAVTYVDPGAVDTAFMHRAGLAGAPPNMLVSPELVARKILLAIGTRPRVLNVAPLQTVVVSIAELFPALTDAVLTRNPALVGGGPTLAAIDVLRDGQGRGEKIALPATPPLPLAAATETLEPFPLQGDIIVSPPPGPPAPPEPPPLATLREEHADAEAAVAEPPPPPVRWTFEPPEEASEPVATATLVRTDDDEEELEDEVVFSEPEEPHHAPTDDEPARATSSFDAAIESLRRRMDRAKLDPGFVRGLLVKDAVIDVHEVAMRWAGMPNKHERALTSEVFFALSEWGFLAPRADGRYRVLLAADEEPEG